MKKLDLKDFMVVQLDVRNYECENDDMYLVIGNTLVSGVGYMNLSRYDENMENIDRDIFFDNSIGTYSIVKVFKIKNIGKGIEFFFNEDNLKLIWERQREIDWSKVPKWTKVQVRIEGTDWFNMYFYEYNTENDDSPYLVKKAIDDDYSGLFLVSTAWQQCRIHPSVTIPEEWYKEVE